MHRYLSRIWLASFPLEFIPDVHVVLSSTRTTSMVLFTNLYWPDSMNEGTKTNIYILHYNKQMARAAQFETLMLTNAGYFIFFHP